MKDLRTIRGSSDRGVRVEIEIGFNGERFCVASPTNSSDDEMVEAYPDIVEPLRLARLQPDAAGRPRLANCIGYFLRKGDRASAREALMFADEADLTGLRTELAKVSVPRMRRALEIEKQLRADLRKTIRLAGSRDLHLCKALHVSPDEAAALYERHVLQASDLTPTDRIRASQFGRKSALVISDYVNQSGMIWKHAYAQAAKEFDPVGDWVADRADRYAKVAATLRGFIGEPDLDFGFVARERDWSTFEGFAALTGIGMMVRESEIDPSDSESFSILLTLEGRSFRTEWGSQDVPKIGDVLSALRLETRMAHLPFGEWCEHHGFDAGARDDRERYDDCRRFREQLDDFLGPVLVSYLYDRVGLESEPPDLDGPFVTMNHSPSL